MSQLKPLGRLHVLDTLRGLMLVLLAVDHYGGKLRVFTYEPLGFATAAESFIFLSGLLLGILYVVKMQQTPGKSLRRLWSRSLEIYLAYSALLVLLIGLLATFPLYAQAWRPLLPEQFAPNLDTLIKAVTLYYPIDKVGILTLYVSLFLLAPILLWIIAKGYEVQLLVVSFVLYAVQPLGAERLFHLLYPEATYNIFTWVFLFILGMSLGYRYRTGNLKVSYAKKYLIPALAVAVAFFLLREASRFGLVGSYYNEIRLLFSRMYLAPLRLLNFFLLAYFAYGVAQRWPYLLRNKWLSFLGQHSLYVFIYHALIFYLIYPFIGFYNQTLESIVFVASLTIPAWLHQSILARNRERQGQQTKALTPQAPSG